MERTSAPGMGARCACGSEPEHLAPVSHAAVVARWRHLARGVSCPESMLRATGRAATAVGSLPPNCSTHGVPVSWN